MKLLLTSSGVQNETLVKNLLELVGKPFSMAKLIFIPTAADVETDDKGWLIRDMSNFQKLGFETLDIVDIAALPKDIVLKRLESANVLVFGGGNTFHLMNWIRNTGLAKKLPGMLKTKVYVGISAGSMVTGSDIIMTTDAKKLYYEGLKGDWDEKGLGIVPFQIRPHYNSEYFPHVNEKNLREMAKKYKEPIYAIDDDMAIKVVDGNVEVVGEGAYLLLNG